MDQPLSYVQFDDWTLDSSDDGPIASTRRSLCAFRRKSTFLYLYPRDT
jgi:hypothetical protein